MRALILTTLLIVSYEVIGQVAIDLKTLIGKPQEVARKQLDTWGINVSPSAEYNDLLIGYDEGIQVEAEEGIVSTIWIEFTDRRYGAFPYQVDSIITPTVDVNKVISTLGDPDETGDGFKIGNINLGGWIKWNTKTYQLHCEVDGSKVVMVTIMSPDWYPGKE